MQICKKCILTDSFPRIHFDQNGICNYCRTAKEPGSLQAQRSKFESKFLKLIEEFRGRGAYDCLVAFSGGKDSTFTLQIVREKYGLNPLAYTFDNWFQSEAASRNIKAILQNLNVDHLTILPSYHTLQQVFRTAVSEELYSPKTLERASTICTTCLALIRFSGFRIAIEKKIPFLVFGLSPGQAPIVTSVFKTNADMIRKMQEAIYIPLRKHLHELVDPYFLQSDHFDRTEDFPYSINPLAFLDYNEQEMLSSVQKLGWKKPQDTDANSTNCLLNALANQIHMERFGYNPYLAEVAGLVRSGTLSREEALQRMNTPTEREQVTIIKKELGL